MSSTTSAGAAAGRGALVFDDVRIPASHLLGDEAGGFVQVMQGFDYSRALIGLQCLAVARAVARGDLGVTRASGGRSASR